MLTVEDIQNITFRKAGLGGGYKVDDVDEFVDKVVETVKALELDKRELKSRVEAQDKEIVKFKENEESVQRALISAEKTAKQIVMEATMKSDEQLSGSKEDAEKAVRDAKAEADKILTEAKEKAEKLEREAQERADRKNAETDAKVDELLNKALEESAAKIEENNLILEAQKKNIIRLMGEANKFRNSLVQAYKEHLKVINSMSKAEDYRKQQQEMEEKYPPMHGNTPVVREIAPAAEATVPTPEEKPDDKIETAEEIAPAQDEIKEEEITSAEVITDEVKTEAPAEEAKTEQPAEEEQPSEEGVVFFAGGKEQKEESVKEEPENNRQPIVFEMSRPETVSGMLKVDEPTAPVSADPRYSKKNKHKKRR